MYRKLRAHFVQACVSGTLAVLCYSCAAGPREQAPTLDDGGSLDRRMESFLLAFDSIPAAAFVEFLSHPNGVVYRHTRHTSSGEETFVEIYTAKQIPAALQYSGSLWPSFQFQFEGQPVGRLAHHVMVRTGRWRQVGYSRFVPPDADSTSATYVEWQREGLRWAISEFGDESFVGVPLPEWMLDH